MDARDLDMLGKRMPTDDCISRQAALDCFHDWIDKYGDVHTPDEMAEYRAIEALPSAQPDSSFITWLLDKIWDEDMWELNWQAFPEILCRKLTKLGFVRERNGEYERLDQQTDGD